MTGRINKPRAAVEQSHEDALRRLDRLERDLGEVNHDLHVYNGEAADMRRAVNRLLDVVDRRFKATLRNGSSSDQDRTSERTDQE